MYRALIRILNAAGFVQLQYSDYSHQNIQPAVAWGVMLSLCTIPPPGKLESTVRGLKMYRIDHNSFMVTQDIQFGGQYSPFLRGPTPRNLVTPAAAAIMNPAPAVLAIAPILPQHTRASAAAAIAANWMQ